MSYHFSEQNMANAILTTYAAAVAEATRNGTTELKKPLVSGLTTYFRMKVFDKIILNPNCSAGAWSSTCKRTP